MKDLLILLVLTFLLSGSVSAQEHEVEKRSYLDLSLNFNEYKDQVHYGLVFRGLMPELSYNFQKDNGTNRIHFKSELGLGVAWTREIASININLKPAQYDYLWSLQNSHNGLYAGFYSSLNYNYEVSPWLHAGHTYWFTAVDLGPSFYYKTKVKAIPMGISFRSSMLGLTSRPEFEKEDYFYKLNFIQVVKNLHSDLSFASLDKRFAAQIEISLLNYSKGGWTLAYEFEYSAYYKAPKTTMLHNKITFRKRIGKKK